MCRKGDPSDPADLAMVSPYESRSVIVLGNNHNDGDAQAIRAVLALMKDPRFENLRLVVDCMYDENAALLRQATGGRAVTIASSDVIARVTAQACRHTGLGRVFQEILDFEDEDVQFDDNPGLAGQRFGDLVLRYPRAAVIGVRFPDGHVLQNPHDDYVLAEGDQAVVLAEAGNVELAATAVIPPPVTCTVPIITVKPSRILVAGWNELAPRIVSELDKWVALGSTIRVLVDESLYGADDIEVAGLVNIELSVTRTTAWSPTIVAELAAAERYDRVVVLCYRRGLTPDEADARALMVLLQLREFRASTPGGAPDMSVVTEVLDIHDVELARVAGADDFIVSDRLTALMLAQLAEMPEREDVFADLFEVSGSEVCIRPVSDYVAPEPGLPYAAYVEAAHRAGHLAIGYKSTSAGIHDRTDGIRISPAKSGLPDLQPDDQLIVVVRREDSERYLTTVPQPATVRGTP